MASTNKSSPKSPVITNFLKKLTPGGRKKSSKDKHAFSNGKDKANSVVNGCVSEPTTPTSVDCYPALQSSRAFNEAINRGAVSEENLPDAYLKQQSVATNNRDSFQITLSEQNVSKLDDQSQEPGARSLLTFYSHDCISTPPGRAPSYTRLSCVLSGYNSNSSYKAFQTKKTSDCQPLINQMSSVKAKDNSSDVSDCTRRLSTPIRNQAHLPKSLVQLRSEKFESKDVDHDRSPQTSPLKAPDEKTCLDDPDGSPSVRSLIDNFAKLQLESAKKEPLPEVPKKRKTQAFSVVEDSFAFDRSHSYAIEGTFHSKSHQSITSPQALFSSTFCHHDDVTEMSDKDIRIRSHDSPCNGDLAISQGHNDAQCKPEGTNGFTNEAGDGDLMLTCNGELPQETTTTQGLVCDGAYFKNLLERELEHLCKIELVLSHWTADEGMPEEATGKARVVIGKSQLLRSKKMSTFRGLCETNLCHKSLGPGSVTNDDLAGYWGLVQMEIEDVSKGFDALANAKRNNWSFQKESSHNVQPGGRSRSKVSGAKNCEISSLPAKLKKNEEERRKEARQRIREARLAAKKRTTGDDVDIICN